MKFREWMDISEMNGKPSSGYRITNRNSVAVTREVNPLNRLPHAVAGGIGRQVMGSLKDRGLEPDASHGFGGNEEKHDDNGVISATLPIQTPYFIYNGNRMEQQMKDADIRRIRPVELMKDDPYKDGLYILYNESDKTMPQNSYQYIEFTKKLMLLYVIDELVKNGDIGKFDIKNPTEKQNVRGSILTVAFMFKPKKGVK